jgi:hypothetical protein
LLGFVEQAPLPLFDPLLLGRHRSSGDDVLLQGWADPLCDEAEEIRWIGYLDAYAMHPWLPPPERTPYGLLGLVRTIDLDARRHRYGLGEVPAGRVAGELGALLAYPAGNCELLVWDADGLRPAGGPEPSAPRPRTTHFAESLRWASEPLTWRGFSEPLPKLRAAARRGRDAARLLRAPTQGQARSTRPAGYVLREPGDVTVPLYAARQPVTGDLLLSNRVSEARQLGYSEAVLLGHVIAEAPVTGSLGVQRLAIPWAHRFGIGSGG